MSCTTVLVVYIPTQVCRSYKHTARGLPAAAWATLPRNSSSRDDVSSSSIASAVVASAEECHVPRACLRAHRWCGGTQRHGVRPLRGSRRRQDRLVLGAACHLHPRGHASGVIREPLGRHDRLMRMISSSSRRCPVSPCSGCRASRFACPAAARGKPTDEVADGRLNRVSIR